MQLRDTRTESEEELTVLGVETLFQVLVDQRSFILEQKEQQKVVSQEAAPLTGGQEKVHHLQPVLVLHRQEHCRPHFSLQRHGVGRKGDIKDIVGWHFK